MCQNEINVLKFFIIHTMKEHFKYKLKTCKNNVLGQTRSSDVSDELTSIHIKLSADIKLLSAIL